ncbi:MAG: hypothetical protein ACLR0P_14255 [Oscillospiraceae bacterium]
MRRSDAEFDRQQQNIELIASENIVSAAVLAAAGTVLTNKYAEGYPGKRYYGGCQCVDVVENIAVDRACKLFGAEHANVQPHSGAQANYGRVSWPCCQPGRHGAGHEPGPRRPPDPRHPGQFLRQELYNMVSYGVDDATGYIDYDKVGTWPGGISPSMIVAGASAYPRAIDFSDLLRTSPTRWAPICWWTWPTSPGWWPPGYHPTPCPTPTWCPPPPTRPSRGPGAA